MHRFSIIVPVLGDRRLLDDTLASVLRYRPDASQVIVVHDGTYEDPYGLEGEVEFVTTSGRSQLIRLFNCGLSNATGELIALVRPGIELDESWNHSVEAAFDDPRIGCVTPIMITPAQPTKMVAAGVTNGFGFRRQIVGNQKRLTPRALRSIKPLGPTSWAAFYRRSALDQLGAVDEQLDPHYLDLELALGLASLGYQNALSGDCIVNLERAMLVARESDLPHGKSAQRAFRRHAADLDSLAWIARSVGAFAREIITSPLQPSRFPHAIQRLGTWGSASVDRHFADRISLAAENNDRPESTALSVRDYDQIPGKVKSDSFETRRDRHAA